ncbi:hypothetical protein Q3G72_024389 [Acer saccharum]|nr:hypothetical protein Q3G72_029674 [Acer saccharum]KAK1548070.1 hypothetical protein Q3G72_024389 [Acer saccharum]
MAAHVLTTPVTEHTMSAGDPTVTKSDKILRKNSSKTSTGVQVIKERKCAQSGAPVTLGPIIHMKSYNAYEVGDGLIRIKRGSIRTTLNQSILKSARRFFASEVVVGVRLLGGFCFNCKYAWARGDSHSEGGILELINRKSKANHKSKDGALHGELDKLPSQLAFLEYLTNRRFVTRRRRPPRLARVSCSLVLFTRVIHRRTSAWRSIFLAGYLLSAATAIPVRSSELDVFRIV